MKTIPQNGIIKSKGLGDTIGDIVSSFNLDLSSNLGAIRVNRIKKVGNNNSNTFGKPLAFVNYTNLYYTITDNQIWKGGDVPSDTFTNVEQESDIDEGNSDMKVFNNKIYISGSTSVMSLTTGTSTDVITAGLTASPHLLEVLHDRLYITNNFRTVLSINTSDVLATSSSNTLNLVTAYGLSNDWTITSIKRTQDLLWVSLLNTYNGKGLVFSWNGITENVYNSVFELPSGIVSSTVLDNILYVIDTQGKLKRYAGSTFVEVASLPKENLNFFQGSGDLNNSRFIHPNGMVTTDNGTILILMSNNISGIDYEDDLPSGIWEYDANIGLYHKYSLSVSPVGATTYTDFGQQRISSPGALYFAKPIAPTLTDNGILLAGAAYFTNASTIAYSAFCDDTLDTTQKWGYFITTKIFSSIQEQWEKVYAIYKRFTNQNSKIVIKFRTEEDEETETTITWTDIDRFTSSVSLSGYSVGDEVQIVQGVGSGQSSHIKEIVGSTYILDDNFPTACIGTTAIALVSKWRKVGTGITYLDDKQYKELTISPKNTSPFIQFKVCMQFNTKDELNKLQIISQSQVKE